jgi:hypothetical protein
MHGTSAAPERRTPVPKLTLALACALLLAGCGSKEAPSTAAAPAEGAPAVAPAPAAVPAPAVTQASWAPDELEKLVAPIALYPDQLVGQILAASVNSQEVLDGGNWLLQNETLKGDALDAAAQKAGLGPAMRALVQFPTVVDMMCQQLDWTGQLGAAFTSDQKGVLDAVQSLRAQAAQVGNLKSTPQQSVETKTENQKTIIEVKPADPQIVYVPQYNPQVIYTTPPPPPPPASSAGTVSTETAVLGGLLAFGVGIAVGNAIHDDNCYPHWGAGAVYVGPRPFYPPAYVYRPVYGPGFHPASGYNGYRNTNINGNVNINVNNNNYFNQFNKNQNLRNVNQNNISGATRNTGANNSNWKGQSTYAGAHNSAQAPRVNQTAGHTPASGGAGAQRPANPQSHVGGGPGGPRNPAAANKSGASANLGSPHAPATNQAARAPAVDRGYGDSNRTPSGAGASRESPNTQRPAPAAAAANQGAFSGASNASGGSFARSSSARGHASAGSMSAGGGGHHGRGR